jgi:hypothetical protein
MSPFPGKLAAREDDDPSGLSCREVVFGGFDEMKTGRPAYRFCALAGTSSRFHQENLAGRMEERCGQGDQKPRVDGPGSQKPDLAGECRSSTKGFCSSFQDAYVV